MQRPAQFRQRLRAPRQEIGTSPCGIRFRRSYINPAWSWTSIRWSATPAGACAT